VSFEQFVPGGSWRGLKQIKLDAGSSYGLSQRLGYWVYRQFGLAASRQSSGRLTVNNDYRGCYGVEEVIKKAYIRYHLGLSGDGNLYKLDNQTSTWSVDSYRWRGWDPAQYVPIPFAPKTNEVGGDYRDIVNLCNVLNNVSQSSRRTELEKIINLDGYLAVLATCSCLGDSDGIFNNMRELNNHFWYHREDTDRLEALPWDTDGSFVYQPANTSVFKWFYETRPAQGGNNPSVLHAWIPNDPVAFETFKSKARGVVAGPLPAARSRADFIYNQIKAHVYADPYKPISNGQFDTHVQQVKDWILQRVSFLQNELGAPASVDSAAFVSQNIPASMTAGQGYTVTVTMRNNGTTSWTSAEGYRLNSRGPFDNTTWGVNRVALAAADSIDPGDTKAFTFTMTAPATAGTYLARWSMANDAVGGFLATTRDVNVVVTATPPPGTNGARFVSQNVPPEMLPGQTYTVSVTVRNSGSTTWTDSSYRLGSQNPQDNMTWGMNRVSMGAGPSVAPGEETTFSWDVTAPTSPATYNFQWRMRQSGVEWFGDLTSNVAVDVSDTAPPPGGGGGGGGGDGGCGATGLEAIVLLSLVGATRLGRRRQRDSR